MEGSDGQPPGPHPHVHILPCPYYTRPWRADSPYSRGEWGEDVESSLGERYRWALVVARPMFILISLFEMYCLRVPGAPYQP